MKKGILKFCTGAAFLAVLFCAAILFSQYSQGSYVSPFLRESGGIVKGKLHINDSVYVAKRTILKGRAQVDSLYIGGTTYTTLAGFSDTGTVEKLRDTVHTQDSILSAHIAATDSNVDDVIDSLGAYLDSNTTRIDSAGHSDFADSAGDAAHAYEADHADSADYAPVIGGAGGSLFSVHVVDTLYTATDTVGADTLTDTVCTGGGLWAWTVGSISALQTNTGSWDTLTAQLSEAGFDSLKACGDSTASINRAADPGCVSAGAFDPGAITNRDDTVFVYRAKMIGVDCSHGDSLAIYSYNDGITTSWWWKPVCVASSSSWQIIGADCYVAYDSVYAVVFGDTMLVAADSVSY